MSIIQAFIILHYFLLAASALAMLAVCMNLLNIINDYDDIDSDKDFIDFDLKKLKVYIMMTFIFCINLLFLSVIEQY